MAISNHRLISADTETVAFRWNDYRIKQGDKAKVEGGVQFVQRWIAAAPRNRRFGSLAELNAAIRELLERVDGKLSRLLGAGRRDLSEALNRPALRPLPAAPCEYAERVERRVGLDHHVEIVRHHCSVPHRLPRRKVRARMAARTAEIFHEGQRVASHVQNSGNRRHSTTAEHMPARHRRHAGWTPAEIRHRVERIGPDTGALVDLMLRTRTHPEQGFRACLGIVRLAKSHGQDALEAACLGALEIGGTS